jgi:hypothetical protein
MEGLPSLCAECGHQLNIEIKRVGAHFAVVAQCCGAESVISDRLEITDYHLLEAHYKELRHKKYNRRKHDRRRD